MQTTTKHIFITRLLKPQFKVTEGQLTLIISPSCKCNKKTSETFTAASINVNNYLLFSSESLNLGQTLCIDTHVVREHTANPTQHKSVWPTGRFHSLQKLLMEETHTETSLTPEFQQEQRQPNVTQAGFKHRVPTLPYGYGDEAQTAYSAACCRCSGRHTCFPASGTGRILLRWGGGGGDSPWQQLLQIVGCNAPDDILQHRSKGKMLLYVPRLIWQKNNFYLFIK